MTRPLKSLFGQERKTPLKGLTRRDDLKVCNKKDNIGVSLNVGVISLVKGRGCGSFGRVVASYARGQSYKHFTLVNYEYRVDMSRKFPIL